MLHYFLDIVEFSRLYLIMKDSKKIPGTFHGETDHQEFVKQSQASSPSIPCPGQYFILVRDLIN